jgi:hypothetical protein
MQAAIASSIAVMTKIVACQPYSAVTQPAISGISICPSEPSAAVVAITLVRLASVQPRPTADSTSPNPVPETPMPTRTPAPRCCIQGV